MGNYIDKEGNYQNIENLTLRQIYDRGIIKGKALASGMWNCDEADAVGKYFYCSNCNSIAHEEYDKNGKKSYYLPDFCPFCGSDNRREEE